MTKHWFTKQSPGVMHGGVEGVWILKGDDARAQELEVGDLVCIYEVWQDPDDGRTGGEKAIVAISRVRRKLHKPEGRGKWKRVAYMDLVASQGRIPHSKVLNILETGTIRPRKFTLLQIDKKQFSRIARVFKDLPAELDSHSSQNKKSDIKRIDTSTIQDGLFEIGAIYKRSEIHKLYGGQRQGGISTPSKYQFVLLFTGRSGGRFGYDDRWDGDVFLYTGEGQIGNMTLTKGNAAIKDSYINTKELHLFEYTSKGMVKYIGPMLCQGYHEESGEDLKGNIRNKIVFELLPVIKVREASDAPIPPVDLVAPLEELRQRALQDASTSADSESRKQNIYQRSRAIRSYVLRRANGNCEGCGQKAPFFTTDGRPYLEPHHIRSRSDGGPDHPEWVASVCPNCHAKAHYSNDRVVFNSKLRSIVHSKETAYKKN